MQYRTTHDLNEYKETITQSVTDHPEEFYLKNNKAIDEYLNSVLKHCEYYHDMKGNPVSAGDLVYYVKSRSLVEGIVEEVPNEFFKTSFYDYYTKTHLTYESHRPKLVIKYKNGKIFSEINAIQLVKV